MYIYYGTVEELPTGSLTALVAKATLVMKGAPALTGSTKLIALMGGGTKAAATLIGGAKLFALTNVFTKAALNFSIYQPQFLLALASFITFGRFGKTTNPPVAVTDDPIAVSGKLTLTGQ